MRFVCQDGFPRAERKVVHLRFKRILRLDDVGTEDVVIEPVVGFGLFRWRGFGKVALPFD